jgi:putative membrane protein (TIGR04086 family)
MALNNRSIIEGGLVAFGLSMLAGMLVALILGTTLSAQMAVAIIVVNWFCLAGGGWWAAKRAGARGLLHGMLAGLVYLNVSLPLNIVIGSPVLITTPAVISSILNSTFFGALGGYLAERPKAK